MVVPVGFRASEFPIVLPFPIGTSVISAEVPTGNSPNRRATSERKSTIPIEEFLSSDLVFDFVVLGTNVVDMDAAEDVADVVPKTTNLNVKSTMNACATEDG